MSVTCNNCGRQNDDGSQYCLNCGARLAGQQAAGPGPRSYQNTASSRPDMVYNTQPAANTTAVVGVGSWLVMFLLMLVPILNIILLIKWAVSSRTNKNKQNLSRAIIIWMVVCIIITILLGFFLKPIVEDFYQGFLSEQLGIPIEELEQLQRDMEQWNLEGGSLTEGGFD